MLTLSKQKNALIGGLLGGIGGGQLVLLALNAYTNVRLDDHEAALVAGGISTLLLWAARPIRYTLTNGLAGAWKRVVHGRGGTSSSSSSSSASTLSPADIAAIAAAVRDAIAPSPPEELPPPQ